MPEQLWLTDEAMPPDDRAIREMKRKLPTDLRGVRRGAQEVPNLAVRFQDIIIWDNKKWFGEADIRLDALVVHGNVTEGKPQSFYQPGTFSFSRVTDGDRLPTGEKGLVVFYGKPLYFLDIFLMVSRDRKDSDGLAGLLSKQLQSTEIQGAIGALLGLGVAAPQVAMVTAALGAAAVLGNFAYQVLRQTTGTTVGLYRTSWLQYRDKFGIGRHPKRGAHREKDLSFWYEIVTEEPSPEY